MSEVMRFRIQLAYIRNVYTYIYIYIYIFFSRTSTFQLLDKPWSQVSSFSPPVLALRFLSHIGFGDLTARRFFVECCIYIYMFSRFYFPASEQAVVTGVAFPPVLAFNLYRA